MLFLRLLSTILAILVDKGLGVIIVPDVSSQPPKPVLAYIETPQGTPLGTPRGDSPGYSPGGLPEEKRAIRKPELAQ